MDDQPRAADSPVVQCWKQFDHALLSTAPAPRRWLLRHPTLDGVSCASGEGDGLLPLGKVGVLSSEGGAGKTHAMVSLATAITSGRPWLGHFDVDPRART